jgi:GNAT superfamily N-acetyltransferase
MKSCPGDGKSQPTGPTCMIDGSIIHVGPTDWRRQRTIRLRALADAPDAFAGTLAAEQQLTEADWKARLEREDAAMFLAVSSEGADLGLAVGAPYGTVAGLYAMWVAPETRGRGVGGRLVDAVIDWATRRGHAAVRLDVGHYNGPAIALYESRGFVATGVTGTLPPPRDAITEFQMERVLSAGDS